MAKKNKSQNLDTFEETRTKMVGVKLTPSEYEELNVICEELGITKSRYFRYLHQDAITKKPFSK